jgi:antitoxin (DNA-binding transcriptional repressor) of toxin-antitoxin stability system
MKSKPRPIEWHEESGTRKFKGWPTRRQCDAIMNHMRKASVRDLRYRFGEVEHLLREGREIQITKRRRVIATLIPATAPAAAKRPDFLARLKKVYGGKRQKVTGAKRVAEERDRY